MDNQTNTNIENDPHAINKSKRLFEIDFVKGLAVINMMIFHFFYLSHFMGVQNYKYDRGILKFFAKSSHITFIFVVGINLAISYQKYKKAYEYNDDLVFKTNAHFGKQVKRAIFLIFAGIVMSILSYFAFGSMWIKFGIFHFIGVAILLAQPIVSNKWLALITSLVVALLYLIFKEIKNVLTDKCFDAPFLCFISGAANVKYSSLDHFSIIPYFGLVCLGIFVGHSIYKDGERTYNLDTQHAEDNIIGKFIALIGKHSLLIYFLHYIIFYFALLAYKKNRDKKFADIDEYYQSKLSDRL